MQIESKFELNYESLESRLSRLKHIQTDMRHKMHLNAVNSNISELNNLTLHSKPKIKSYEQQKFNKTAKQSKLTTIKEQETKSAQVEDQIIPQQLSENIKPTNKLSEFNQIASNYGSSNNKFYFNRLKFNHQSAVQPKASNRHFHQNQLVIPQNYRVQKCKSKYEILMKQKPSTTPNMENYQNLISVRSPGKIVRNR